MIINIYFLIVISASKNISLQLELYLKSFKENFPRRDAPRRLYEDDIFNSTLGGSKQKREYHPKRKQALATRAES